MKYLQTAWMQLLLLAGGIYAAFMIYGVYQDHEHQKKIAATESDRAERVAEEKHMKNGAYITTEKQISATETIKTIVIPGRFDTDMRCLVYVNHETKQSSINCPGITQEDFAIQPDQNDSTGYDY